jgi:hypothetical protein
MEAVGGLLQGSQIDGGKDPDSHGNVHGQLARERNKGPKGDVSSDSVMKARRYSRNQPYNVISSSNKHVPTNVAV